MQKFSQFQSTHAQSVLSSFGKFGRHVSFTRRSGLEVAGAFLLLLVAIGLAVLHSSNARAAEGTPSNQDHTAALNVQVDHAASSAAPAVDGTSDNSQTDTSTGNTSSSTVTSHTTTTSSGGQHSSTSTVTVNGQQVPVPANGTTVIHGSDGSTTTVTGSSTNETSSQSVVSTTNSEDSQ